MAIAATPGRRNGDLEVEARCSFLSAPGNSVLVDVAAEPKRLAGRLVKQLRPFARSEGKMRSPIQVRLCYGRRR
jgi:hypothetical protein